jgi:uncharacterized protein with von Willebrand factor type A (vWA) domain
VRGTPSLEGPANGSKEALVEACFFRGLGRLADSWRVRPPFPNDNAYADAVLEYRDRTPAIGAMNRWPERATLDLKQYLERWQASCAEIGTPGHLPQRPQELLA